MFLGGLPPVVLATSLCLKLHTTKHMPGNITDLKCQVSEDLICTFASSCCRSRPIPLKNRGVSRDSTPIDPITSPPIWDSQTFCLNQFYTQHNYSTKCWEICTDVLWLSISHCCSFRLSASEIVGSNYSRALITWSPGINSNPALKFSLMHSPILDHQVSSSYQRLELLLVEM